MLVSAGLADLPAVGIQVVDHVHERVEGFFRAGFVAGRAEFVERGFGFLEAFEVGAGWLALGQLQRVITELDQTGFFLVEGGGYVGFGGCHNT